MYKKTMSLLAVGLVFSLIVGTGCGKAATDGIVSKKETETLAPLETETAETESPLDDVIQEMKKDDTEKETETSAENAAQLGMRESLGIPETFVSDLEDGTKTYSANAPVYLPEGDEIRVIPIVRTYFDETDIAKYAEIFLGENGLYQWDEESEGKISEQEMVIRQIGQLLEEPEKFSENEMNVLKGQYDRAVEKRRELIAAAERIEVPLEFTTEEKFEGSGRNITYVKGLTDWSRELMEFDMTNMGVSIRPQHAMEEGSCTIPESEAKEIADKFVEKMGLSDEFVFANAKNYDGVSGRENAYSFQYMRQINGVPIQYGTTSLAESLSIGVDDKGILSVNYHFPFAMDLSADKSALLPFAEIEAAYEKAVMEADLGEYEERKAVAVTIDEVRLGYEVIYEEGREEGIMIPAWDFYGSVQYHYEYDPEFKAGNTKEEIEMKDGTWEQRKILSINAVDGTVIK